MILGVHGLVASSISGIDADAQAFITAAGITDATQQAAINTLVVDLKGYGIWSKMKALYPFVGGTASTHKYNLKDPRDLDAAFRLVFNGGWTHSSTGATPNGTNGYADTFLTPSTSLSTSSAHLSFYSRTNTSKGYNFGAFGDGSSSEVALIAKYNNGMAYLGLGTGGLVSTSNADGTGFYVAKRTTNSTATMLRNNSLLLTNNNVNTALNTISIYLGAAHANLVAGDYDNKETAFASIGDGLSDTEASNFYTAVQAFQTSLSRQV